MPRTEDAEQKAMVRLLRSIGGQVYSLSQGYRPGGKRHATTRQTKGLPDLWVFLPPRQIAFWLEVKKKSGHVKPEQIVFGHRCEANGVPYCRGGVDDLKKFLTRFGYKFL